MAPGLASMGQPEQRTTDGVFGSSGAATVVWSLASSGGVTAFHDAAGATNAVITLAAGQSMHFPNGCLFASGLYADVASSTTASACHSQ
jgi:hypothetical protein